MNHTNFCTRYTSFKAKSILLLLLVVTQVPLFAQNTPLRFQHLTVEDGLPQNTIQGIAQDKYGFMWFGTWNGLCKYNGYTFTTYQKDAKRKNSIPDNRIHMLFKDSSQHIWISFSNTRAICRYNYETDDFTRYVRDKVAQYIRDSLYRPTRHSNLKVLTNEYTWEIDPVTKLLAQTHHTTGQQRIYKTDPLNPWALNDEYAEFLFLDKGQNLWVGTYTIGINKADTQQKPFGHYNKKYQDTNSLIDNIVRTICEDKQGNIWVGTRNKGVSMIDRANNRYTHYTHNKKDSLNSLISDNIRKIYCDRFGEIWIGTKEGLTRFDPQRNRFYSYSYRGRNKIPSDWIYAITEDSRGYLWIGTRQGLAKYDRQKDRFYAYDPKSTLSGSFVRVIFEDKKKNLWVATEGGGLTKIRRDSSTGFEEKLYPTRFVNNPQDSNSLSSNAVFSMLEDEKGIIWIGTNNGLNRFDPQKNEFTLFSSKDGLPDILIMGILSDGKGHIWISHKKGLTRLDTKTYAMKQYTLREGLQSNEFSEDAYYRSKKTGEMFFGGVNGFNAFFPDRIQDNPYPPDNVFFTDLKILNMPVGINESVNENIILTQPLYLTKEITLTHKDKSIAIEFAALHYANPQGNIYAYMLEGFDKDWIYTNGSNRVASYSNLDPKAYVLKVKAANSDGVWNPIPATLKITVLPPFWKTMQAYVLYWLLFGGLLFLLYQYVVGREKMKNQLLLERIKAEKIEEINQLKLQFFTSISHEFRTPLSLIIDPLEKLLAEEVSPTQAKRYYTIMAASASRLLKLITQLLDFRKSESGHLTLEASYGDIVLFTKAIADTFQLHAEKRSIRFSFEATLPSIIAPFDPDKLDKIIYNLLSNAFKYTPNQGEIRIQLALMAKDTDERGALEVVTIRVEDSGIGIGQNAIDKIFDVFYQVEGNQAYEGEGTGIGLALTKELVKLHTGEITVESEVGRGTCFTVSLPLRNKPLDASPILTGNLNDPKRAFPRTFSADEPEANSEEEYAENGEQALILLVEDNEEIRNYIENELKHTYQVVLATDGMAGFDKAAELMPTLIISDIMMPKMDGIELCKKLKTDERTSHIPVILLTARQSTEYKIEGYETGADAYITKPFSTAVLMARIKNLIDSRRALRERYGKSIIFDPKECEINVTDEAFINRARKIVEENLSNVGFDGEAFADNLKISRTQAYKKIKALTNQTVHDFITTIKLNKAAELLLAGELSIAQVAYEVGYTEPTNFRRSFVKQFGQTPKNYILSVKEMSK